MMLNRQGFTAFEDRTIVRYLCEKNAFHMVRGNSIWKEMEKAKIGYNRSYQSLRNRFLRNIAGRLHSEYIKYLTQYEIVLPKFLQAPSVSSKSVDVHLLSGNATLNVSKGSIFTKKPLTPTFNVASFTTPDNTPPLEEEEEADGWQQVRPARRVESVPQVVTHIELHDDDDDSQSSVYPSQQWETLRDKLIPARNPGQLLEICGLSSLTSPTKHSQPPVHNKQHQVNERLPSISEKTECAVRNSCDNDPIHSPSKKRKCLYNRFEDELIDLDEGSCTPDDISATDADELFAPFEDAESSCAMPIIPTNQVQPGTSKLIKEGEEGTEFQSHENGTNTYLVSSNTSNHLAQNLSDESICSSPIIATNQLTEETELQTKGNVVSTNTYLVSSNTSSHMTQNVTDESPIITANHLMDVVETELQTQGIVNTDPYLVSSIPSNNMIQEISDESACSSPIIATNHLMEEEEEDGSELQKQGNVVNTDTYLMSSISFNNMTQTVPSESTCDLLNIPTNNLMEQEEDESGLQPENNVETALPAISKRQRTGNCRRKTGHRVLVNSRTMLRLNRIAFKMFIENKRSRRYISSLTAIIEDLVASSKYSEKERELLILSIAGKNLRLGNYLEKFLRDKEDHS